MCTDLFCLIWFLTSHQQCFSYKGTGLPGLNQYLARINVLALGHKAVTPLRLEPSVSSQALYHWATALPLNPYCKIHFQFMIPSTTGRKLQNRAAPGDSLIFSYIRRLGSCFAFEIFNFIIFVFFWKMIFGGAKICLDILRGYHKIRLYLGVISMHFRVFS